MSERACQRVERSFAQLLQHCQGLGQRSAELESRSDTLVSALEAASAACQRGAAMLHGRMVRVREQAQLLTPQIREQSRLAGQALGSGAEAVTAALSALQQVIQEEHAGIRAGLAGLTALIDDSGKQRGKERRRLIELLEKLLQTGQDQVASLQSIHDHLQDLRQRLDSTSENVAAEVRQEEALRRSRRYIDRTLLALASRRLEIRQHWQDLADALAQAGGDDGWHEVVRAGDVPQMAEALATHGQAPSWSAARAWRQQRFMEAVAELRSSHLGITRELNTLRAVFSAHPGAPDESESEP